MSKKNRTILDEIHVEKERRYRYLLTLQSLNLDDDIIKTNHLSWDEFKDWCKSTYDNRYNKQKRKRKSLSKKDRILK